MDPQSIINEKDIIGRPSFIKREGSFLFGVNVIDKEFEIFRYRQSTTTLRNSDREKDFSPIAFDENDEIIAVLAYYKSTGKDRDEETALFIYDRNLVRIAKKTIYTSLKKSLIKIYPTIEPALDKTCQVKVAILSEFELSSRIFKLTHMMLSPESRGHWELTEIK